MSDEQERAAVRALDFVRPAASPSYDDISMRKITNYNPASMLGSQQSRASNQHNLGQEVKIGSQLRIRVPDDYAIGVPSGSHNLAEPIVAAQSRVQEGPGYVYQPSDDVQPAQYPFAYRLWKHLHRHGAVCAFEKAQFRGKITSHSKSGEPWVQIHVATDEPEALGDRIMASVGGNITFGELAIPDYNGMSWAGYQRSGGVWVRHFGDYQLKWDAVIQRWDVLVARSK